MNYIIPEEALREACCLGDNDYALNLIQQGVNVNSKHKLNGWTALHWASHRGHASLIKILLNHGSDPDIKNNKGETALDVAFNNNIKTCFHGTGPENHEEDLNKEIFESCKNETCSPRGSVKMDSVNHIREQDELVLKVRKGTIGDFIEIELPLDSLTFDNLILISCKELELSREEIIKVRKLPNTIIRKDKDVKRLDDFQEIEFICIEFK